MPTSISYIHPVEIAADKRLARPEHELILHSIHDRCPDRCPPRTRLPLLPPTTVTGRNRLNYIPSLTSTTHDSSKKSSVQADGPRTADGIDQRTAPHIDRMGVAPRGYFGPGPERGERGVNSRCQKGRFFCIACKMTADQPALRSVATCRNWRIPGLKFLSAGVR